MAPGPRLSWWNPTLDLKWYGTRFSHFSCKMTVTKLSDFLVFGWIFYHKLPLVNLSSAILFSTSWGVIQVRLPWQKYFQEALTFAGCSCFFPRGGRVALKICRFIDAGFRHRWIKHGRRSSLVSFFYKATSSTLQLDRLPRKQPLPSCMAVILSSAAWKSFFSSCVVASHNFRDTSPKRCS